MRPIWSLRCGLFAAAKICLDMNLFLTFTGGLLIDGLGPDRVDRVRYGGACAHPTPRGLIIKAIELGHSLILALVSRVAGSRVHVHVHPYMIDTGLANI